VPDQLSNIERAIGELRGDVRAILRQMEQEREDAKDSRARVYERVERVEQSVTIAGQIAAQARDKATAVETTVTNEVKPQTDKLKNLGVKGGGFLAGAALVGGFAAQPVWAAIANAFDKLFKP
jgi:protein subunit release factor B